MPPFFSTFRNRSTSFHPSDRNVKLYTLRQIIEQNFLDPNDYILDEKEIIWSHESQHHPDFAKFYGQTDNIKDRIASYSLGMTFVILGSVICFIIFVYINHIIMAKKLKKQERQEELQALIESSLALLASSGQTVESNLNLERKSSLLNAFRKFRL
uniref:Uncharacterized protein n=1 Tax=Panagrolaimus sp. PS1159 TaxID=55785 RepID=A0AC35GRX7_9BILA